MFARFIAQWAWGKGTVEKDPRLTLTHAPFQGSDASVKSLVERKTPVRSPLNERRPEPRYQTKTVFPERPRDDVFRDTPTQPSTPSQRRVLALDPLRPAPSKQQPQPQQQQQQHQSQSQSQPQLHNQPKSPSLALAHEKKIARRAKYRLLLEKRNKQRAELDREREITMQREEKLKEEQSRYEALRQKEHKDDLDSLREKVTNLEADTDESRKMVEEYAEVSQVAYQENEEKLDELSGRIITIITNICEYDADLGMKLANTTWTLNEWISDFLILFTF